MLQLTVQLEQGARRPIGNRSSGWSEEITATRVTKDRVRVCIAIVRELKALRK